MSMSVLNNNTSTPVTDDHPGPPQPPGAHESERSPLSPFPLFGFGRNLNSMIKGPVRSWPQNFQTLSILDTQILTQSKEGYDCSINQV
jgi:hypothetical protein